MSYAHRRDPDARRAYMRGYTNRLRAKRRAACIKALGGVCVDCGAAQDLDFDHKNPRDKVDRVARLWTAKKAVLWREVMKCELRCKKCHAARHAARGEPGPLETAFIERERTHA